MVSASEEARHGLPWPDRYADLQPELREHWGVDGEIYLVRKLSGGKSGALVYVADLSSKDFSGQAILKFDDYADPASQEQNEAKRHREAMESAPDYAAEHLPRIVNTYFHGRQLAILSTIAGRGLEYAEPWIASPYDEQRATAGRLSREILEDWNRDYKLSDGLRTPQDLLRGWLDYRLDPKTGRIHAFLREQHNLTADQPSFVFDGDWFPNPLHYVDHATEVADPLQLRAVVGNLHGDLHGQNVLVAKQAERDAAYYLIDLALFESGGYLFYDHAYFELTYLLRSRDNAGPDKWLSILDSAGRLGQGGTVRQGDDLGLVQLIAAVRRELFDWVDRHEANRLAHMESQALLARIAVGLCFAHRRLSTESRSMAFLYAARSLKDLLQLNGVDWPKYGPDIAIPGAAGDAAVAQSPSSPQRRRATETDDGPAIVGAPGSDAVGTARPGIPGKLAIAVLPFENLSSDPEQGYFANGVTEDLITELCRIDWLTVVAQDASKADRKSSGDLRAVAESTGARYIVTGSARRSGDTVRVTAHLIDALNQTEVWGDRFDRQVTDLFAVQDEIAAAIVANVDSEAKFDQRELAARKRGPLSVWEMYQKSLWHFFKGTPQDDEVAVKEIHNAARAAPEFAGIRALLAIVELRRVMLGFCSDQDRELRLGAANAKRAVELDDSNAMAHMVYSGALAITGEREAAVTEAQVAIKLNPSAAMGHFALAGAYYWSGRIADALPALDRAVSSNPRERLRIGLLVVTALCNIEAGNFEKAEKAARQVIQVSPNATLAYLALAIIYVRSDRLEDARRMIDDVHRRHPDYGYPNIAFALQNMETRQRDRFLADIETAGLRSNAPNT